MTSETWRKTMPKEKRLLFQPRKTLISSFTLQTGTLVTSLLLFKLQVDLACTKKHRLVAILVGISTQKRVDSHLDKTRAVALKIWSCLTFNEEDLIVKLTAFTLQAHIKNDCFSVDGFCFLCNTVIEAMGCFHPVKNSAQILLKSLSNVALTKENSMNWDEAVYRSNVSLSLKCGNVTGGDFTRQPLMLNYIFDRNSNTDDHLQNTIF